MLMGILDRARIRRAISKQHDGNVIKIKWTPFGPGWFWATFQSLEIYLVRYRTPDGEEHEVYAQTRLLGHVDFWKGSDRPSYISPKEWQFIMKHVKKYTEE